MGNREIVYLSLLSALALVLYIFEAVIPKPFPWLKFGLANLITLIVLINFGWKQALWITLIRIIGGSIFVGALFTPVFVLSLCGGLMAFVLMAICFRFFYPSFSIIGLSIIGATAHNFTQLIIASLIFVRNLELLYLLPIFSITSLLMGAFTGFVGFSFQNRFFTRLYSD